MVFDRPPFISSSKHPQFNTRGNLKYDDNGNVLYEDKSHNESVPNIDFLIEHGISPSSHPAYWFDMFMPRMKRRQTGLNTTSIAEFTSSTNKKAILSNAGQKGEQYAHFQPFSVDEAMKHLDVYMINGVSPSPQVAFKFESQSLNSTNDNDICYESLGSNAQKRHRDFEKYFAVQDPIKIVPPRKAHPN